MRPFILLLLWLMPTAALAQHPSFWTLDNAQGLPSLKVYDLMEDSLGVMWMGTSEGLAHYDGLRLQTIRASGARSDNRSILHPSTDGRV
jgi:ligand-binding sensor domain-containing protein